MDNLASACLREEVEMVRETRIHTCYKISNGYSGLSMTWRSIDITGYKPTTTTLRPSGCSGHLYWARAGLEKVKLYTSRGLVFVCVGTYIF